MRSDPPTPDLSREQEFWDSGAEVVAGLDEVGRGAWAGPLVVVAAALRASAAGEHALGEVRDSKKLTPARRSRLFEPVASACAAWAVGAASAAECDEMGMSAAQRLAASRALSSLDIRPDAVLLDGRWDFVSPETPPAPTREAAETEPSDLDPSPGRDTAAATGPPARREGFDGPVRTVVGGDARCVSLAAASILAKVWRDDLMVRQAALYPAYNFDSNKGYPCPRHRAALAVWGPSAIHRHSWAFMDNLPRAPRAGEGAVIQPRAPARP